jgi:hypothetical protein
MYICATIWMYYCCFVYTCSIGLNLRPWLLEFQERDEQVTARYGEEGPPLHGSWLED